MGGADGSLFGQDLRDAHPGFFKRGLLYHAITDTWSDAGPIPSNQVTTIPVRWDGDIVLASGEIRPRVRSPQIWRITPRGRGGSFGAVNYTVLVLYLLGMVGIGVYFANKNASTDDYFRGGKKMVWWAAGCSIFATMLSSLTYTGIPSKAFAQDWVYLIGNFMIFLIAPLAIYIALPFFRYIDATSAYEYMEKRFNRGVRLFSSASFTLFHIFRMAVVMSLTALALAVATPLSPAACVLIMGVLSIIYCTLGGIEAVIWTDTVQTVILLGGGILAFVLLVMNVDGGFTGFLEIGANDGKFHMVNLDFSSDSYMRMAIWVVILGSFGQNISSYTADQAVVQRYMTTPTQKVAARSIWTNAILSVPASLLFFAIGAGLYAFYKSHPEKLDPGISTDQIFPLFIADDMPIGIAGLIVAGIFAAAQSTVSTSMNSTATTLVTDFMRPLRVCRSEAGYLRWARILTFLLGAIGTAIALLFINPSIRSLFDSFIKIIGLFMGVLGGLFLLGIFTRRGNGLGALLGALAGAGVMLYLGVYTKVNGYIYAFCGVSSCFVIGYLASLILPCRRKDLDGLTFYSIRQGD
jgi:solute:Na+ symporter, SSS family